MNRRSSFLLEIFMIIFDDIPLELAIKIISVALHGVYRKQARVKWIAMKENTRITRLNIYL